MGYTTDFSGTFRLDKYLSEKHAAYLTRFSVSRRMKRDPKELLNVPDPLREDVFLPVGEQGEYFVGMGDPYEDDSRGIVDYNTPPGQGSPYARPNVILKNIEPQPNLWCHWAPTETKDGIEWDGSEKFNEYIDWLDYLIRHFLQPWGYTLNGEVTWEGEDSDDLGKIVVQNNVVTSLAGAVVYG